VRGNSQLITRRCGSPLMSGFDVRSIHSCSPVRGSAWVGPSVRSLVYSFARSFAGAAKAPTVSASEALVRTSAVTENVLGDLLEDADRPRILGRRGFYCSRPCFLACIFHHQLSELMFNGDSRRKLELSPEMIRAHWLSCRNRRYAGNGVVANKYLAKPSAPRIRGPSSLPERTEVAPIVLP
jgi:hypothetical protein